ncbi:hypothetical protein FRC07_004203 [Ceratobasidium sp. 392]|nr:hypothetical protein FRC07_004203 [Ceratobasidium sp. 392]
MGNIHTKLRNQLNFERIHNIATVAMDIEAQHPAAGLTRKRTRRCFDIPRPPPALRTDTEAETAESNSLPDLPIELINGEDNVDLENKELEGEDELGAQNLTALAAQFNQALDDDDDGNLSEELEAELPEPAEVVANSLCTRPRRLRLYFSKAHAIPLSKVFDFSDSVKGVEDGLGVFWKFGVASLAKERDVYEAIASMCE